MDKKQQLAKLKHQLRRAKNEVVIAERAVDQLPADAEPQTRQALEERLEIRREDETNAATAVQDFETQMAQPEKREWAALVRTRGLLTEVVHAQLGQRPLTGVAAEVHAELAQRGGDGVPGYCIPLEALVPEQIERRVDEVTLSSELTGVQPTGVVDPVQQIFEDSTSAAAGFRVMPIDRGEVSVPRLTSAGGLVFADEDTEVDAVEADSETAELSPRLGQRAYVFPRAALAKMAASVEAGFQAELMGLARQSLDDLAVSAIEANASHTDRTTSGFVFSALSADMYSLIDGKHAMSPADSLLIARSELITKAGGTLLANADPLSFYEKLNDLAMGFRASSHLTAPTAEHDSKLLTVAVSAGRIGYIAVWGGIGLLIDPYTGSNQGRVKMTVSVLADAEMSRPSACKASTIRHAA